LLTTTDLMYLKIELLILKINDVRYSMQIYFVDFRITLYEKNKDYRKYLQEQESDKKKKMRELFK